MNKYFISNVFVFGVFAVLLEGGGGGGGGGGIVSDKYSGYWCFFLSALSRVNLHIQSYLLTI